MAVVREVDKAIERSPVHQLVQGPWVGDSGALSCLQPCNSCTDKPRSGRLDARSGQTNQAIHPDTYIKGTFQATKASKSTQRDGFTVVVIRIRIYFFFLVCTTCTTGPVSHSARRQCNACMVADSCLRLDGRLYYGYLDFLLGWHVSLGGDMFWTGFILGFIVAALVDRALWRWLSGRPEWK